MGANIPYIRVHTALSFLSSPFQFLPASNQSLMVSKAKKSVNRRKTRGSKPPTEQLDSTAVKARRTQNSMASISKLPVELLSHIFVLTRYKAPGKLAILVQVCHYWREVAIDTAELWTRIPCSKKQSRQRELHLERSKTRPLDVALEVYSEKAEPVDHKSPVHVLRHLSRIERLRVNFVWVYWHPPTRSNSWDHENLGRLELDTFEALCRQQAPKLRVLELHKDRVFMPGSVEWIANMFLGAKLRRLTLEGIGIPWDSHLLSSSLTNLHINTNSDRPFARFTPQEMRKVLARLDRLEHLHLQDVVSGEHSPNLPKVEPVHLPPGLKTLTVREWSGFCIRSFFTIITFPGTLDELSVHMARDEISTPMIVTMIKQACRDWGTFWSGDVRKLFVGSLSDGPLCHGIRGATEAGSDRLALDLPSDSSLSDTCSVLYTSGAHRIRAVEWGADAGDAIHRAILENTELERVAVDLENGMEVLGDLGRCLVHPEVQEKTMKLEEIVIRALFIEDEAEKECFSEFIHALATRRDAGQTVPRIRLSQWGRIPWKAYEDLCGVVGDVIKERNKVYTWDLGEEEIAGL